MVSSNLKEGWARLYRMPSILILLIFYQIFWGIVLYAAVQTVISPLIARVPFHETNSLEFQMFLIEGQFRLTKTTDAWPAMLLIVCILSLRMLCTPILNAGLFHALRIRSTANDKLGLALFWQGCKTNAASFYLLHFGQWVAYALPLISLFLFSNDTFGTYMNDKPGTLIIGVLLYAIYVNYVRLLFTYLLLGKSKETGWKSTVAVFLRGFLTLTAMSFLILLLYLLVYCAISAATVAMASLVALSIHFAANGLRVLFKTWEIAAHSRFFDHRINN